MNDSSTDRHLADSTCRQGGGMLQLLHVAKVLQSRIDEALESVGLSVPKYQVLDELVRAGGPVPLSTLADRQRCVRSNITQLVDRLETDGLVRRTDDPDDRRGVRAAITPEGAERYAAGASAVKQVQDDLAAKLSSSDRADFMRILSVFRDG